VIHGVGRRLAPHLEAPAAEEHGRPERPTKFRWYEIAGTCTPTGATSPVHAGVPADRAKEKSTVKCASRFRDGPKDDYHRRHGICGVAARRGRAATGMTLAPPPSGARWARDTYGTSKAACALLVEVRRPRSRPPAQEVPPSRIKATAACAACIATNAAAGSHPEALTKPRRLCAKVEAHVRTQVLCRYLTPARRRTRFPSRTSAHPRSALWRHT